MASDLTAPAGDVDLFTVAQHAVRAYRRFHYLLPSEVDDVMSDACLGAVKAARSYDPKQGSTLATWAYTKAQKEILEGVRRRAPITRTDWAAGARCTADLPANRQPPDSLEHEDWTRQVPDPIDRYAEIDEALDDRALIGRLLAVLPARERQVVERHYLGDEQGQVIAADLGVSPGRVSQLLKVAFKQIRQAA